MAELFLGYMGDASKQVAILYIIAAAGFAADKFRVFTSEAAKGTNDLLFYIITPAVIINSFLSVDATSENIREFFTALGFAFLIHIVGIVVTLPIFRGKKDPDDAVYKFAGIYANMGYMALPLANAVLGSHGVFICSAGVVAYNIFAFTHGVWLMTGGGRHFRLRSIVLNPGIIAVAIGMPLFLLHVKLPAIAAQPLSYIASLNTPLAMIMLGAYMSGAGMKDIFTKKKQYLSALMRSVVIPAVMFGIYKLAGVSGDLLTALMISSSAPSAMNTVMFAVKYGHDTGNASKAVAFDCLVSILTIPFFIAISRL